MVVTCRSCANETGMTQVRIGSPSMCIVQAPHAPTPQPNLLPVSRRCSRTTQSSGTSSGPSNSAGLPFTWNFTGMAACLSLRAASQTATLNASSGNGITSSFRPVACSSACATAGATGASTTSPTPCGGRSLGWMSGDDLRHLVDAEQRIVEEIALIGAAVRERDLALERVGQGEADAALDLRLHRVRIDRKSRIDRADHALDREPVADAPEFGNESRHRS